MKAPRIYLEEMSLFLLLSGHPGRQDLLVLLTQHLKAQGRLCTSVFALSEVIRLWDDPFIKCSSSLRERRAFLREWENLFEEVLSVEHRDLQRALALQEEYKLSHAASLHVSLVYGNGIEAMTGLSEPYAAIPLFEFLPLPASL